MTVLDLDTETQARIDATIAFAASAGLLDDLRAKLEWLDEFGGHDRSRCVLFPDSAPHCFEFVIFVRSGDGWQPILNGLLALHGAHDGFGAGQAPTFAATVAPTCGFAIHT